MPVGHGNPHILPVERHHMTGKLQAFLLDYLGTAQDAAVRAKDMAIKFEEHVYMTTDTKDAYVQTIQARMKYVQVKKGQPAPVAEEPSGTIHINDNERTAFFSKMEQFRGLLPRMEKLIDIHGRLGTNPDMLRKYAGYKNVIQRQLELLPSSVFIMPLATIASVYDQCTKMTVFLATRAKELIAANPEVAAGRAPEAPQPPKIRLSPEEVLRRKFSMESLMAPVGKELEIADLVRVEPDMKMVEYEIDALQRQGLGIFSLEKVEEGILVKAKLENSEALLRLPSDYPSSSPLQVRLEGQDNFSECNHFILSPISLTTTIKLMMQP